MADAKDRQALLTTLTTEHFTLQGARSQTIGESGARSALYLGSVSSTLKLAGEDARFLLLSGHDDPIGVISNMGLGTTSRWQLFFGTASAVSVVNGVVGTGGIAILLGVTLGLPLVVAAAAGVAFLAASVELRAIVSSAPRQSDDR